MILQKYLNLILLRKPNIKKNYSASCEATIGFYISLLAKQLYL